MKTQIKKFLWFDITPRKELYNEIDDCEKSIKTLSDTVVLLKNQTNEKNIKINALTAGLKNSEDKMYQMHETIESNKEYITSLEQQLNEANNTIVKLQDDLSWSERLSKLKDYDIERLTNLLLEFGYDDNDCGCDHSY